MSPGLDALRLSGSTRVVFIVGDPIAQVKSPEGVTQRLRERGVDAVCVPAHVRAADLAAFVALAERMPNVDAVLVTVPHKFAALPLCASLTPRARSIEAVNAIRRGRDGRWHGDMCDGQAFAAALQAKGAVLAGQRALLVGAGGAGSAIAHALVDAGVAALALHDSSAARREALAAKLRRYAPGLALLPGSDDPAGFGVVCNATPLGMRHGDPLPVQVQRLDAGAVVGDVVTLPELPPLVAAARARGLVASTGGDMFAQVKRAIIDFLLEAP